MAKYPDILPLVPPEANQDAIDKANAELNKRWRGQIGKPTGQVGQRLGTTYYEYDNNGVKGWYRPDPSDPSGGRVIYFHPTEGEQTITLGGDEYARQRQKLVDEVSGHTENPLTYEQWGSPLNLTYGELLARKRIIDRSVNSNPAQQSDIEAITGGNLAAQRVRGLIADYKNATAHGGNFDKFSQMIMGLKNQVALDSWAKGDPQRQAYLKVMGDLIELNNLGINNVGKFPQSGKGADALTETLNSVLGGGNLFGKTKLAVGATGASAVITLANAIVNGGFDPAAIATNAPNVLNRIDYQVYNKSASLSDPAAKVNLPEAEREMGRQAKAELEANGMGPDKTVASTTLIDEVPKDGDKGGGEESTETTPTPKPTSTPTPTPTPTAATDQKPSAEQKPATSQNGKTYPRLPAATFEAAPVSTTGEPSESEQQFAGKEPVLPLTTGPAAPPPIANKSPAAVAAATPPAEPPQPTSTAAEFANQVPAYTAPPSWGAPVQPAGWLSGPKQGARTPEEQKALEEARKPSGGLTPDQQKALEERVRKFGAPPTTSAEPVASDVAVGAPLGANDAPGVARLHHQEHVDLLQPGTPFYWRDHPHAYVRV